MPSTPFPHASPSLWTPPGGFLPVGAWFGMTTRRGGVSAGPYATFNVSLGVGDEPDAVNANRARLRSMVGYEGQTPLLLRQVHGDAVVRPSHAPAEADGFLVVAGDPWVGVSAADCAPVAVASSDGRHGALLHSGWRGALAGIGGKAVGLLAEGGAPASTLSAVIGPCIHACCFPVGADVAAAFDPSVRVPHPSGQEAIDLPAAIRRTLVEAGVPPARIAVAPECTSCREDLFYSHRRDRGLTGRHWALLRLAAAA